MYVRHRIRGLGQQVSAGQIAGSAAAIGTSAAAAPIAGALGVAVPVIGLALAGITLAVTALIKNSGCGPTCVETSQWANQAEPLLAQNIQAYFAQPAPRSQSSQAQALANFDNIWTTLQQQCSQPGTGNAGKRCISDRQAGACTIKQTANSPLLKYPGQPQPGQCWNWFSGYRDPIANDATVPDTQAALASASSTLGVSPSTLLLLGAAALLGLVVFS
jgi:hypothetical protein